MHYADRFVELQWMQIVPQNRLIAFENLSECGANFAETHY